MTVARWAARTKAAEPIKPKNLKWSDGDVSVRIKQDRSPLVWIAEKDPEGSKLLQRCQMRLNSFEKEDDGVKLMQTLAEMYVAKKVLMGDLYAERDKLYKSYKEQASGGMLEKSTSTVRKKPSAAVEETSAPACSTPPPKKARASSSATAETSTFDFPAEDLWGLDEYGSLF